MKKKKKTIILVSVLIIIILLALGTYILLWFENHTGIIMDIDKNSIITEESHWKHYTFPIKDALIVDSNWHKIDISNLKVGDTIYVINKKANFRIHLASVWNGYSLTSLKNIKLIKVVDNNPDKFKEFLKQ